jgi:hypothetical protein
MFPRHGFPALAAGLDALEADSGQQTRKRFPEKGQFSSYIMSNRRTRCIFWSRELSNLGVKVAMFSSRRFEALEELSG